MKLIDIFESVEDKGLFKAIFMAGLPGAGKSYTLKQITSGSIQPRIVNTDKFYEFLSDKQHTNLLNHTQILNKQQLALYINGMLPLYIDGTSANPSALLRRVGILESIGYDVGMVWVDTDINTAVARASKRSRFVDPEYIQQVNNEASENKKYYQTKFNTFIQINNNEGELTNEVIQAAYNRVNNFFNNPIKNAIGLRSVDKLRKNNEKYLVPSIMDMEHLHLIVNHWYV